MTIESVFEDEVLLCTDLEESFAVKLLKGEVLTINEVLSGGSQVSRAIDR